MILRASSVWPILILIQPHTGHYCSQFISYRLPCICLKKTFEIPRNDGEIMGSRVSLLRARARLLVWCVHGFDANYNFYAAARCHIYRLRLFQMSLCFSSNGNSFSGKKIMFKNVAQVTKHQNDFYAALCAFRFKLGLAPKHGTVSF